ncbi:MAG: hypothetical protein ACE5G3_12965 [Gammaproteobacteria bacterium]
MAPIQPGKTIHAPAPARRAGTERRLLGLLLRRLWLPGFVYEALPYLYILCGLVALVSALYTPDWTWILPWAVLVGLLCLHAGLALVALRYRWRKSRRTPAPKK